MKLAAFRVLKGAAWLYLVLAALWFTLPRLTGDTTWWSFLLATFAHLAAIPLLLIAPFAWWRGGRVLSVAATATLALASLPLASDFAWRRAAAPEAAAPTLTVASWNVNVENRDVDAIVAVLEAIDADVVALLELSPPVADAIEARLGERYPHRVLFPSEQWGGMGIVGRYPLERSTERIRPSNYRNPLIVEAGLPGGPTTVVAAHFTSNSRVPAEIPDQIPGAIAERELQARALAELVRQRDRPVILVGDLNTTARSDVYRTLTGPLVDAWRAAGRGFGFTFPGGAARPVLFGIEAPPWLLRIDYVFATEAWTPLRASVGPWDGRSDHRPVVVRFRRETPPPR